MAQITHLSETVSTNADALQAGREGCADNSWFIADRQTGGRGRRGRVWVSEPGNLYCSVVLRHLPPGRSAAEMSFVAALALDDALQTWIAPDRLAIKWPNDLLLDGLKLAGILLESQTDGDDDPWVVLGLGVNIAHHPKDVERPATSLSAAGLTLTPAQMFNAFSSCFARWRSRWHEAGISALHPALRQRMVGIGQNILIRLNDRELEGRFERIDDFGALVLLDHSGERHFITAGDVFIKNG